MTKIGEFRIENKTRIIGRGEVALGQIIEGLVKIGAYVRCKDSEKTGLLQIKGIEMADNIFTKESWVGLQFGFENDEQLRFFENLRLNEILEVVM